MSTERLEAVMTFLPNLEGIGNRMVARQDAESRRWKLRHSDPSGLSFGAKRHTQAPRWAEDVQKMIEKGIAIHIVEDDVAERGLERGDLVGGLKPVARTGLPALFAQYDQVWHW